LRCTIMSLIDQLEKESRVLRARDVAKLFQVTPQHVYKMAAGGRLPSFRLAGQFVSIRMNWRTGFEKRSQLLIGWTWATNCVVAHSSPLRGFSTAVRIEQEQKVTTRIVLSPKFPCML